MKKLIILLLVAFFATTQTYADSEYKKFKSIIVTELKQMSEIKLMPQEYCDKESERLWFKLWARYRFATYDVERTYIKDGKKHTFIAKADGLTICRGAWKKADKKEKLRMLIHEAMERYYHNKLDTKAKQDFEDIYNRSSIIWQDFYSSYGAKSPREDFIMTSESLFFYWDADYIEYPLIREKRELIKDILNLKK